MNSDSRDDSSAGAAVIIRAPFVEHYKDVEFLCES